MFKRFLIVLLPAAMASMALSGCAVLDAPEPVAKRAEIDQQYVGAVERASRRQSVRVIWVNPPTRNQP